jgi:hypothetical protein
LTLVVLLTITTACTGATQAERTAPPLIGGSTSYTQLERGNTPAGQNFGDWVVQTAKGLIQDTFVRDNDKLGVVITPKVRPNDVRPLAKSLVQGFHHNFPNRDLTVLMYAPDKQLILTAQYNNLSKQIEYQTPKG